MQFENQKYRSMRDVVYFKGNTLLSGHVLKICLTLHIYDLELCKMSLKKHTLCSVYWILNNLPPPHSVLCESDNVRVYGYSKILEPLLQELFT